MGGTHVRLALADFVGGERPRLGETFRYRTREYPDLAAVWRQFSEDLGATPPRAAGIGVAAPFGERVLRFPNSPWMLDTEALETDLGLEKLFLLNDFGAMAHAVSMLGEDELIHLEGPDVPLPPDGVFTIIGPGTGLGVAILVRRGGTASVIETEGSHIAFAPLNAGEAAIHAHLKTKWDRVSVERIVSGPGLADLVEALTNGARIPDHDNYGTLWSAALNASDADAARALDHWVQAFGAAAGDLALAHGATAVVITGSIANRAAELLKGPLFAERFLAKGRYRPRMEQLTVKLATHPEPGLLGAAIAFARANGT